MPLDSVRSVTVRVRIGYCLAIVAIAVMGVASFVFQHRAIQAQRDVNTLVELVSEQQMLGQRLVLLTNLAHHEDAPLKHAVSVNALRDDLAAFEAGHAALGERLRAFDDEKGAGIANLFFEPPYDVNFFGLALAGKAHRFLSHQVSANDLSEIQPVSQMQSMATHAGLSALKSAMVEHSRSSIEETSNLHRLVLAALLALLALESLLIFAPLTRSIKTRTDELKRARDKMSELANHDQLTGLHNRTAMAFQFPEIIARHATAGTGFALVHLDLDDFKIVNDTYGHAAGDAVLKEIGKRLSDLVRTGDFTARIGGDEFVLIMDGLHETDALEPVLERVLSDVGREIRFDDIAITVRASAGAAAYPCDACDMDTLLVAADLALYRAKAISGCSYMRYQPYMSEEFKEYRRLKRPLKADKTVLDSLKMQPTI